MSESTQTETTAEQRLAIPARSQPDRVFRVADDRFRVERTTEHGVVTAIVTKPADGPLSCSCSQDPPSLLKTCPHVRAVAHSFDTGCPDCDAHEYHVHSAGPSEPPTAHLYMCAACGTAFEPFDDGTDTTTAP